MASVKAEEVGRTFCHVQEFGLDLPGNEELIHGLNSHTRPELYFGNLTPNSTAAEAENKI